MMKEECNQRNDRQVFLQRHMERLKFIVSYDEESLQYLQGMEIELSMFENLMNAEKQAEKETNYDEERVNIERLFAMSPEEPVL